VLRRSGAGVGFASALAAAALLLLGGPLPAQAASPFPWRGVVEGQYGTPWDHGMRMRLLAFTAAHGFNAYIHAPKDDPYGRTQWRDPYPAAQQAEFDQEIAFAAGHGVQWIPDLSPAVPLIPSPATPGGAPSPPICFSCPSDLQVLVNKLEPFLAAGSRTVMISFDDTQKALVYPQDVAAYGSGDQGYGAANADLLNRLLAALRARRPGVTLLTVGADYSGTQDTSYLDGLRARLDPSIEVFWTGTAVGSRNFSPAEVGGYAQAIGRKPIVWDNWTVNDDDGNIFNASRRIHLGSYPRRPDIVADVRGFFLNPMNEADLNELPFVTAGDYFADPYHYDATRSYQRAAAELGGRAANTLRAFAEVNFSDPFDPEREAPTFTTASQSLLASYGTGGGWPSPRDGLDAELALVRDAGPVLAGQPRLSYFVSEAAPFLITGRTSAVTGLDGSSLLAAERPGLTIATQPGGSFAGRAAPPDPGQAQSWRAALARDDSAMLADPHETYGYRAFVFDVPPIPAPPNKMDAFVQAVQSLDRAWLPAASRAAASVRVTLDGRDVALDATGAFVLPRSAAGRVLEAIDGAGGRTDLRVPTRGGTASSAGPAGSRCSAAPQRPARRMRSRRRHRHPRRSGQRRSARRGGAGSASRRRRRATHEQLHPGRRPVLGACGPTGVRPRPARRPRRRGRGGRPPRSRR